MKLKNKKICLLLAGGTIISEQDRQAVNTPQDIEPWLNKLPELNIMGELTPVFICGEENHPHGPALWQKLSAEVFKRYNDFDGFIITNAPHDMLYNAIALSFALKNISKPVVFTGSPLGAVNKYMAEVKKFSMSNLGVRANLINAVQIAGMPFGAVGIVFGKFCLRAVKAHRTELGSLNIFTGLDDSYLAKIDFSFSLFDPWIPPSRPPELKNNFEGKVLALDYYPGLDFEFFSRSIGEAKGILLKSVPLEPFDKKFLANLKKLPVPVLVYNRFFVPPLNADNLFEVFNLTKDTALVKFMWALGQSKDFSEIRDLMVNGQANEFLKNSLI
ncbi:MAG: asparaginase domain-containing protein [Candidatus Komeilibacteria bacterium]|nr:asparaginase domain-containing protein [Candidatus Komeilibacteria bacterium]